MTPAQAVSAASRVRDHYHELANEAEPYDAQEARIFERISQAFDMFAAVVAVRTLEDAMRPDSEPKS